MRLMAGMAVTLAVAGCSGIRYTGTEQQMQQVARGAAEMAKKNPYSDMVTGAGTAAHMALSATMGGETAAPEQTCTPGLNGCYDKAATSMVPPSRTDGMDSFTGLPAGHYKQTAIGRD